jgi:hypothetical protein
MKKNNFEDLEKKVLKKGWGRKKSIPDYEVYKESEQQIKKLGWQESFRTKEHTKIKSLNIFWAILFFGILSTVVYYFYFLGPVFNPEQIKMYISGPQKISSGEKASFKVSYRNDSNVVLRGVKLDFEWPDNSVFENKGQKEPVKIQRDVGVLMPNQEKVLIFEGRVYGEKDSIKTIKAKLSYTPSELERSFEIDKEFKISIETIPIFLNVSMPEQVVSKKEAEIKVEYINQSDASFSNMEIRAEYPSGFEFISSNPNPAASNNVWQLGTILGGEEGSLTIRGKFNGTEGEKQTVSIDVGEAGGTEKEFSSFASSLTETQLASSALLVFQTVNDSRDVSLDLGSSLTYKISYKNTTNTQISNIVILAQVDDSFVDLKTLSIPWGSFDGRTNSIIWNQSGVPELAVLDPKEEGSVSFSVKVKQDFIPKTPQDKNLEIRSTARIASGSIPDNLEGLPVEDQDVLKVKLNTIFSFNTFGYYNDGPIKNFGPLPPKVGEETSYAVSWQMINTTNDIKDVVVRASIPPNIKWTGFIDPKDAGIIYNPEKGTIEWRPGIVFAGSGYTIPSQRVDFQLSFLPALVHVGKKINLISDVTIEGVDVFTGKKIERIASGLDSGLKGAISSSESTVSE